MLEIILIVMTITMLSLMFKITRLKQDNLVLGKAIIENAFNKVSEESKEDDAYIIQENFLKFVSDSREWAFDYIENTQEQLRSFINDLEKDVVFFENFGNLTQEYPHYDSMSKLAQHYRKIEKLLPEQDKND